MTLLRTSFRQLLHHPLRTGLAVAGVAVATAMLLDMLMLGAGLQRSFEELLVARGYELRVSPRGTLPFDTDATVPGASRLRDSLRRAPGVADAAPVLAANLTLRGEPGEDAAAGPGGREPAGERTGGLRVFAIGADPEEQGLYRLVEGREPAGAAEAVVGLQLREEISAGPGDSLTLATASVLGSPDAKSRRYRIVGTAEFLYASADERPLALRLEELQRVTGRADRASFFMVRLRESASASSVAAALRERVPSVEVASAGELMERAGERLSYFRQLALILGTVSLIVAVLLVGTLMAVSVSDRYGTIAALRAIGISRRSLVVALTAESLALCAAAGLLGLGLGSVMAGYLEGILSDFPGLPRAVRFFVLRPRDLIVAYGSLLAAGAIAALLPAWRAARLEIAPTLHREEP